MHDPLTDMFTFLTEKRDRAMTQRWGVWLTKKDAQRALKVPRLFFLFHITLCSVKLVDYYEGIK
jgi:hypothetical protein